MKVTIISEINSDNLGDVAIYICLKKLFEYFGCEVNGLDLKGEIFFNNKFGENADNCNNYFLNLNNNFSIPSDKQKKNKTKEILHKLIYLLPNYVDQIIILCKKKYLYVQKKEYWTESIKKSDLVIFGGGALLMDNLSFPLSLYYWSKLLRDLNLPYGVFGCSVGEKFTRFGGKKMRNFLAGAEFIIIRDKLSGIKLDELGYSPDGICIDPAIYISKIIKGDRKILNGTIGLNILSYVRHPNIRSETYLKYMMEIEETILKIDKYEELGFKRIIVFNTGEFDDMIAGCTLFSNIKKKLRNLEVLITDRLQNLSSLCSVINECDIVIGTRMHSCIISKSFGIPIIGISWDKKIDGYFDMIRLNEFCLNYKEFTSEMILHAIKQIKDNNFYQKSDIQRHQTDLKNYISHVVMKHKER